VISSELLADAQELFGHKIPIKSDTSEYFSFSWGGNYLGESYLGILEKFSSCKDILCLKEYVKTLKEWRSMPANILSADSSGNIGYFLASPSMALNNSSPYLSSSMLDGSISDNDALGIVPIQTLPFSINPSKGFFAAANNRVMPENSKYDVGTSGTITPRATRINEILRAGIDDGRKFTNQDMIDIQNDVVDVVARDLTPKIIQICKSGMTELSRDEVDSVEFMLDLLEAFDGKMSPDSISASVYNLWNYFFLNSLFIDLTFDHSKSELSQINDQNRINLVDRSNFIDFYQKVVNDVALNKEGKYEAICIESKQA